MNNICKIFQDCSSDIRHWLAKQPEVKEESMTDRFLFDISEKLSIVRYKQFSRMEEGRKTGADWEWWFLFRDRNSFCARVQAKKLKTNEDNYAGIAYPHPAKEMLQIDKLISDSYKNNFAPMYVFYSSESSRYTLCRGRKGDDEGVFISDAVHLRDEIISKPRKRYLAQNVLQYANPISCLFCCPLADGLTYEGLKKYFSEYFPTIYYGRINTKIETDNFIPQGFVKTPDRILQFMNKESDTWWEKEHWRSVENTNALLVIDLRNEVKQQQENASR